MLEEVRLMEQTKVNELYNCSTRVVPVIADDRT